MLGLENILLCAVDGDCTGGVALNDGGDWGDGLVFRDGVDSVDGFWELL